MTASQPFFQNQRKEKKSSPVKSLTQHVLHWQKLTKIIQHVLPQPEVWQVARYQDGVLTLSGENQAMISKVGYLQQHYVQQLSQIDAFKDLQAIHVRLRKKTPQKSNQPVPQTLSAETQNMLQNAAKLVNDPKLSQAIQDFASPKPPKV